MANIGVSSASYVSDIAVSRFAQDVSNTSQKLASAQSNSSNGNKSSSVTIADTFQIDVAATKAAVQSMNLTKGYLGTSIKVLDNASSLLTRLYELAILGANSSNSPDDALAIDAESERIADRFHALMSNAQYKGRELFQIYPESLTISAGGRGTNIKIGAGSVDYDVVYDYINPGVETTEPGTKYEITKPLTDEEKDAIISQTDGLTREDLVVGFQFTTNGQTAAPGPGIRTKDLYYLDGDGAVLFDAAATVVTDEKFNGGLLELAFTSNGEASDDFTLVSGDGSAGTITITGNILSYIDEDYGAIEFGEIVSDGQNGSALRVNFYEDASIPGTSELANGDFSNGLSNWTTFNDRVNFGLPFTLADGTEIPTPNENQMADVPFDQGPGNPDPSVIGNDDVAIDFNRAIPNFTVEIENGALRLDQNDLYFIEIGYGIVHGPAAVSDVFSSTEGDYLKLDYTANYVWDDYHVAGYLVNTLTDEITMAISETGTRGSGSVSVEVPVSGDYRFVFVNGTFDRSGLKGVSASMTIDNIRSERPFEIYAEILERILRSITYSSSSNDQANVKDVLISARTKNDTTILQDESKIFNTEFNGKIMLAPKLDLENAVSTGGNNNLGPEGNNLTDLVTENIEVVQSRINTARVRASSQYAAIEQAINSATDLNTQFSTAQKKLMDINFALEAVYLTKQQMMENAAAAILAQANRSQEGLLDLVSKSE
jgi:flagellin-like hook-associated protein FlgL